MKAQILLLILIAFAAASAAAGTRIGDLTSLEGVRDNQLVGYGLVVGLNGTGDKRQTVFSAQSLANLLDRMGVQVAPSAMLVRNTAAVLITANLPPFAQSGNRIDVTVAAVGDASNLQGGLLILTPLKAANGDTYAVAQGSVVTGGFGAGRGGGNSLTVNHPTAGRIPQGAIIERNAPSVLPGGPLRLQLRRADFSVAARIAETINRQLDSPGVARAEHAGAVVLHAPPKFSGRIVELLAVVEQLTVDIEPAVKVVIHERTGTIVSGKDVRIRPVAVLHGSLSVEIQTRFQVSQPEALSRGQTTVAPEVSVGAKEEKARSLTLKEGATIEDLAKAMLAVGSTPRDLIAVLQSLKAAGALDAELEVL